MIYLRKDSGCFFKFLDPKNPPEKRILPFLYTLKLKFFLSRPSVMYPESCTEKKFLFKFPLIPKLLVCIAPTWKRP